MIETLFAFTLFLIAGLICWFSAIALDEYKRERARLRELMSQRKGEE